MRRLLIIASGLLLGALAVVLAIVGAGLVIMSVPSANKPVLAAVFGTITIGFGAWVGLYSCRLLLNRPRADGHLMSPRVRKACWFSLVTLQALGISANAPQWLGISYSTSTVLGAGYIVLAALLAGLGRRDTGRLSSGDGPAL